MKIPAIVLTASLCLLSRWANGGGEPSDLDALIDTARTTESSALIMLRDGEVLAEYYPDEDIGLLETMSVTKSIVALGVARMLTTGELPSLDTAVAEYFPEWRQGSKRDVTIRHLLNHTSGLQNLPNTGEEIYPSPDFVQLALAAELEHLPGERFSYNNKAVNLIAGLFPRITDARMDQYIAREIFAPLGIDDWNWSLDDARNPHGMSGLQLHPSDLARLGQLVLDEGRHDGVELIAPDILAEFMAQGSEFDPTSGLLWWREPAESFYVIDDALLQRYGEAGVPAAIIDQLEPIKGRYADRGEVTRALAEAFGSNWQQTLMPEIAPRGLPPARASASEDIAAWFAQGYLGQYLVVVPETGVVAVRMLRPSDDLASGHEYAAFPAQVARLEFQ